VNSGSGVDERVRSQYDDYYADGPSEWRRLGALDKAANVVALCGQLRCASVLEIGAGDGSILSRLSELGFAESLYGLDISSSGVEVIKRREIPRLVECRTFDGSQVPYESGRFDLAILSHVVEHLEHPRQLLYEAARTARYVFVEVPLEDMSRYGRDYRASKVGHINFYSRRTIRWLLQSCGLRILGQATTNPSKATYVHAAGRKGLVQYYVKQTLLTCSPELATRHFCYHEALLATGVDSPPEPVNATP
jgi:ubiquinone/menaquinone biosynthesis C-methylase UbiE